MNYFFPFDAVPKNSRIILYGAGTVGKQFYSQVTETSFCEIVLWLDKKADGILVKLPETIADFNADDYDAVIIAIESKTIAFEIKAILMNYGVPENKILHKSYSLFERGYFEKKGMEIFKMFPNWRLTHDSFLISDCDIAFLLGLIADYKFTNGTKIKNVLEIGVFKGVTALYMLKAGLLHSSEFQLYGIDISKSGIVGEAVFAESSIEEQKHYHLFRGHTCFDIEKIIPKNVKIDMVFIDGGHSHPTPLFNLIHSIPFLHNESIVVFHDTVWCRRPNYWGESFVYTSWTEKKYQTINVDETKATSHSLGCIKIPTEKSQLYENIKQIARIPFRASPSISTSRKNWLDVDNSNLSKLMQFMIKYYDESFAKEIYQILKENLNEYEKNYVLYHHETELFNYLFEENRLLQKKVNDLSKKLLLLMEK